MSVAQGDDERRLRLRRFGAGCRVSLSIPQEILNQIPSTFSLTAGIDPVAHLHFSLHRKHWYVTEHDGHGTFYGVTFDGRGEESWCYFSLAELQRTSQVLSMLTSGPPLRTQAFVATVQWDDQFEPTPIDVVRQRHPKARG